MADNRLSVSSKRSLSPSPPDLGLSLLRLSSDPELPDLEYYLCNFVDPSVGIDTEFLDPLSRSLSFTWKGSHHRLLQLTAPRRFTFARLGFHQDWFSHFILFLESTGYEIQTQDTAPFASPKKTCSARQAHSSLPPRSVSNSFEALSSMTVDVPPSSSPDAPSLAAPKMDFKSKVPPITLRLTETVLPAIKPLLHKDSRLIYRSSKVTVRASSLAEYKSILSTAAANHLDWLLVAAEDDASGRFAVWIADAVLFRLIPLFVMSYGVCN